MQPTKLIPYWEVIYIFSNGKADFMSFVERLKGEFGVVRENTLAEYFSYEFLITNKAALARIVVDFIKNGKIKSPNKDKRRVNGEFTRQQVSQVIYKIIGEEYSEILEVNISRNFRQKPFNRLPLKTKSHYITKREAEILIMLSEGKDQHAICKAFNIKNTTYRAFLRILRIKLTLNDLDQIRLYAMKHKVYIQGFLENVKGRESLKPL